MIQATKITKGQNLPQGNLNNTDVSEKYEYQKACNDAEHKISLYNSSVKHFTIRSMDNICLLFNTGFKAESNAYLFEHSKLCHNIANAINIDYGQSFSEKTIDAIEKGVEAVKNAVENAIDSFCRLIDAEEKDLA